MGNAELVAAVSNAGGLGILGTGYSPPAWIKEQIDLTRLLTDRPFGVNIMLRSPSAKEAIDLVKEEGVPVVTLGGGDPSEHLEGLKSSQSHAVPVVADPETAAKLAKLGADAVIAEGTEAGGHIGRLTTMTLVPQISAAVSIPVIAAGGIASGSGLVAAMALGASGIQMGTRFVCSEECIAHRGFKERIIQSDGQDAIEIGRTIGRPIRCLANRLTEAFLEAERRGASLEEFFTGKLYVGVIEGDLENGFLMAGQCAGLIKETKPAQDIVREVITEAESIFQRLSRDWNRGWNE